jgi:hypothetical protein
MIQEDYKEIALTVKELLSSSSGRFDVSMAPMIGGGFTGDLMPVGYSVFPVRQICKSQMGKVLMDEITMFFKKIIDIDEDNDIIIYAETNLLPNETVRILEAWMQRFMLEESNRILEQESNNEWVNDA